MLRCACARGATAGDIKGARVTTSDEGRYRVGIVLYRKGDRLLKVVANPPATTSRRPRNVLMQVRPHGKEPLTEHCPNLDRNTGSRPGVGVRR